MPTKAAGLRSGFGPTRFGSPQVFAVLPHTTQQKPANNLQQSWRFDGEPPKAVLSDIRTIDWILGRPRSSAQADLIADRPILGF
jgi:hypothetical protein